MWPRHRSNKASHNGRAPGTLDWWTARNGGRWWCVGVEAEKEGAWLHWIYYPPLVAITNEIQCAITYFHRDTRKSVVLRILPPFFLCLRRYPRTETPVGSGFSSFISSFVHHSSSPTSRRYMLTYAYQKCEITWTSWYLIGIRVLWSTLDRVSSTLIMCLAVYTNETN